MVKNDFNEIYSDLKAIYTYSQGKDLLDSISKLVNPAGKKSKKASISQKDMALITYADSINSKTSNSLITLNKFIHKRKINDILTITHILPFYPWDTDRGFSVIDYRKVDPKYGNWKDIKKLSLSQKLMFDFVANHISIDNPIAQESLIVRHVKIKTKFKNFLIAYSENDQPSKEQLKNLARPRPNPVLTPYFITKRKGKFVAILGKPVKNEVNLGTGLVWTTFSRPLNKDGSEATRQVDLNFHNPEVLIETLKILLFYIEKGAKLIRLDAIGYIWKKLGSTSLHEKEAHIILHLINSFLKITHPEVITIAEINEQQDKVIGYLGTKKRPESDMVYQFTHFPLSIYSLMKEDVTDYNNWYLSTKKLEGRQFITILGSHDGLGLKPVRNILSDKQVNELENYLIEKHRCLPNFAQLPGGQKIIYELCATAWNLINPPDSTASEYTQMNRYLATIAMGLTLRGLPAFYINGLLASPNYQPKKGLDENRTINREQIDLSILENTLSNSSNVRSKIFDNLKKMLKVRSMQSAFDPLAPFPKLLKTNNKAVFGVVLVGKKSSERILCLTNVSQKIQKVFIPKNYMKSSYKDILQNKIYNLGPEFELSSYQILWLKKINKNTLH